jgi:GNAT superfamily N-acetyltransferase
MTVTIAAISIRMLDAAEAQARLDELADILVEAVALGASVNFLAGFSRDGALAFWRNQLPGIASGERRLFVGDNGERLVATALLMFAQQPNQPHRAEVGKMLVHPEARRRGLARALMLALEDLARAEGRTLLTLDAVTGSHAEALYRSLGYVVVGVIPRFALKSLVRELEPATFMYKELGPADGR